jgi:hypothetical protein
VIKLAKVKVMARDWEIHVSKLTPIPVWVRIGGITTFTSSNDKEDADVTDFDDQGYSQGIVVSRTGETSFEGHYLEDDEGQQLIDDLSEEMGHESLALIRLTRPSGRVLEFCGTFTMGDVGGGNNDITSWGASINRSGKPINKEGIFVGTPVNIYDANTGQPIKISEDGNLGVNTAESEIMQGVDLQDHMIPATNPIPVKGYSAQVMAQTGVNVRDTNNQEVLVDVSALTGEKLIVITSTLNQPVTMTAFIEGNGYTYVSGGSKAVLTNSPAVATSVDIPALKAPVQKLRIRIKADTAPTSGSVTVYIEGVQA